MEQGNFSQADLAAPATQEGGPLLRDYLLRPWYAKLWWGAVFVFWPALFLADAIFEFQRPWTFVPRYVWLELLLHPFTPAFVLGLLFIQAWWRHHIWDQDESEDAQNPFYDGTEHFGFHKPRTNFTDPLDPYWMTNPANPSSKTWRDRHLR